MNDAQALALLAESQETFEELADLFDSGARSLRVVNVLIGARADLASIAPHMVTAGKVFGDLGAMRPRLEALIERLAAHG